MQDDPLAARLRFLQEIDALKSVVRQTKLVDGSRRENSAEHSWHLAMYAWTLADYAPEGSDPERVVRMLLLHDIVEVDAGDTPFHGAAGHEAQAEKELRAAHRIFGLLPAAQRDEALSLWLEFEAAESPDARFAKALDRLQPFMANVANQGGTWADNGLTLADVVARYGSIIGRGSPRLWALAERLAHEHFGA